MMIQTVLSSLSDEHIYTYRKFFPLKSKVKSIDLCRGGRAGRGEGGSSSACVYECVCVYVCGNGIFVTIED